MIANISRRPGDDFARLARFRGVVADVWLSARRDRFAWPGLLVLSPLRHRPRLPRRRHSTLLHAGLFRTAENLVWYFGTQIDVLHRRADPEQRRAGLLCGGAHPGIAAAGQGRDRHQADRPADLRAPAGRSGAGNPLSRQVDAGAGDCCRFRFSSASPPSLPTWCAPSSALSWVAAGQPLAILALGMTVRPAGLFIAPFLLGMGKFRASMVNSILVHRAVGRGIRDRRVLGSDRRLRRRGGRLPAAVPDPGTPGLGGARGIDDVAAAPAGAPGLAAAVMYFAVNILARNLSARPGARGAARDARGGQAPPPTR